MWQSAFLRFFSRRIGSAVRCGLSYIQWSWIFFVYEQILSNSWVVGFFFCKFECMPAHWAFSIGHFAAKRNWFFLISLSNQLVARIKEEKKRRKIRKNKKEGRDRLWFQGCLSTNFPKRQTRSIKLLGTRSPWFSIVRCHATWWAFSIVHFHSRAISYLDLFG